MILDESLDFADKFSDSLTDNIPLRHVLAVLSYVHIEFQVNAFCFDTVL